MKVDHQGFARVGKSFFLGFRKIRNKMSHFEQIQVKDELLQAIRAMGFEEPTPIQKQAIPPLLDGRDIVGQAQTGTGKTAAYALPMLERIDTTQPYVQGFILTPTRELALQVSRAMEEFAKFLPVRVLCVYGGQPYGKQLRMLREGVQVVVGTPGRVLDLIHKKDALDLSQLRFAVLDEADEMLKMGFIEDVENILSETPETCQKALFSATMPKEIRQLANRFLKNAEQITVSSDTLTLKTTEQRIYLVHDRDKFASLMRLLEVEPIQNALIFARTKIRTAELAEQLLKFNFPAEALHGDLTQVARESALNRFRKGVVKVLVATDVAARGLDIQDVSHVFNYDLPFDAEDYVHRIGRTGRAGATGTAISFVTSQEIHRVRRIEKTTSQPMILAKLPNEADIKQQRITDFEAQLIERMAVEDYKAEIDLTRKLMGMGYEAFEIAAAAMQIAKEGKKYPPIYQVGPVKAEEIKPSRKREERSRRGESGDRKKRRQSTNSHEQGMVRLSLSLGKADEIKPRMVVGAIANQAKIPGKAVGAITIKQHQTFVDVSEQYAEMVIKKLDRVEFNGKKGNFKRLG
ncbi:MAG: hypothetical protein CL609_05020 [Anaerolineaceae bacterium]|nr:hypothetical protein [Anaerolineaceae bacterium]